MTIHLICSIKYLSLLISKNITTNLMKVWRGKQFFDESFHLGDKGYSTNESEDKKRYILNSSKDSLKSSKINLA